MSYEPQALSAALAAAVGNDPVLVCELRTAFLESGTSFAAQMAGAGDDQAWRSAALRLKGLAASFGAFGLIALADEAASARRGDRALLARIEALLAAVGEDG